MPNHLKDRTGQVFGRLTVRAMLPMKGGTFALCYCECGSVVRRRINGLVVGTVKSCGCLRREYRRGQWVKHDEARNGRETPEYLAWAAMKRRCYGSDPDHGRVYRQRGIIVCDRWRTSFSAFLVDMGRRPSPEHSLDRYPNNAGNYEPGNCRWATRSEQAKNRRKRPRLNDGRFSPGAL